MSHEASEGDEPDDFRLVDVTAFGHRFDGYPSGLAEDLLSLEREGAVYSHFADTAKGPDEDGLWEFRYYRIELTPREIVEYVEASRAYIEFHNARSAGATFDEALSAVSNPEIAERVRTYHRLSEADGDADNRGCHASFYPDGMEDLLCGGRTDRYDELPESADERDSFGRLMQIVNNFPLVSRLLRNRGYGRPDYVLENEYDVQDLTYALIRATFDDARREEWTPKRAGGAKRIDITVASIDTVVELKFVRDEAHARNVADELRIDFECYHERPECRQLVALVVDPNQHITDPVQFGDDLSGLRQKGEHSFEVSVLVR